MTSCTEAIRRKSSSWSIDRGNSWQKFWICRIFQNFKGRKPTKSNFGGCKNSCLGLCIHKYFSIYLYIYIYIHLNLCIYIFFKIWKIYIYIDVVSLFWYRINFDIASLNPSLCGQVRLVRNKLLGHSKTEMTQPHVWTYLLSYLMCLRSTFVNMSLQLKNGKKELTNGCTVANAWQRANRPHMMLGNWHWNRHLCFPRPKKHLCTIQSVWHKIALP